MTISKRNLILGIVALLVLGTGLGFVGSRYIGDSWGTISVNAQDYYEMQEIAQRYSKLEELRQFVVNNYYEDIDEDTMMDSLYRAIFEATGDVYSEYFTAEEYDSWESSLSSSFSGIGVVFSADTEGNFVIVSVIADSPAEKAGLLAGDYMILVDGESYETTTQMSTAIRGEKGTKVTLTYERDGQQYEATMVRDTITVETVYYEIREDGLGYIQITSFESETAEEFSEALTIMEEAKVTGLIIDIRDNGGGYVDQCIEIADMLLGSCTVIYTEDGDGNQQTYTSSASKTSLPYVLLVNENSASASEILACAVQDNNGGALVGTVTFGKGIIQRSGQFSDGSGFKLTVMQYFSPNGYKIHGVGVTPDYQVENSDDGTDLQLEKAVELLLQ